jgi:methionine--tRNA ligase beta chain
MATIDDFAKIELKVGKIMEVSRVEGSEKLLKMIVDFGAEQRQILAGIAKAYAPEDLLNKQHIFVTNLEPRMLMGFESQGMILAATGEDGLPVLICPVKDAPSGSQLH